MKKNIVITGSSGFLGSSLARYLMLKGHFVTGIDVRDKNCSRNPLLSAPVENAVSFDTDVASSYEPFKRVLKIASEKKPIDFLIHLAAKWDFDATLCARFDEENRNMTKNVIRAAKEFAPKRTLFASSTAAIDPSVIFYDEKTPILKNLQDSNHPYGRVKAEAEMEFGRFAAQGDGKIAIMRLTGIYDHFSNLPPLTWMIERWANSSLYSSVLPGIYDTGANFLYIEDFVAFVDGIIEQHDALPPKAILLAAQHAPDREFYTYLSSADLFQLIKQKSGNGGGKMIRMPKELVKLGLLGESYLAKTGLIRNPREPLWITDYIDNPMFVDCEETQQLLKWRPKAFLRDDISFIMHKYRTEKKKWNVLRNAREMHNFQFYK